MWLMILVSSLLVADVSVQPERPWTTVPIITQDPITVRLKVRKRASLSDENWIGFEFENTSGEPLKIKSHDLRYRIESQRFNLRSGALVRSGGLASGTCHDLFPEPWKYAGPVPPVLIEPGVTSVFEQPSADALLGLPSRDGLLVRARVHFRLVLEGDQILATDEEGVPFSFEWVYPDEAGFAVMRKRLRRLLENPPAKYWHPYICIRDALLGVPEVSEAVTVEELLLAIDRQKNAREGLVSHISQHFPRHPKVIAFYRLKLKKKDGDAVKDLYRYGGIWHDDFLEMLLSICEGYFQQPSSSLSRQHETHWSLMERDFWRKGYDALRVLAAHRERWPDEANVPARLSAAVLRANPILLRNETPILLWKPDKLEDLLRKPHDIEAKIVEAEIVRSYWPRAVGALGLTGDKEVIPILVPFLDCRGRIREGGMHSAPFFLPGGWEEVRICDSALHGILTLMGEDPHKAYGLYGPPVTLPRLESADGKVRQPDLAKPTSLPTSATRPAVSWIEEHDARVCQIRDEMIAELKKRLDNKPTAD